MNPKENKARALETEELTDVRGGSFMSCDCPDKDTSVCTQKRSTCSTEDKNKERCAYPSYEVSFSSYRI